MAREQAALVPVEELHDDDYVVVFRPRDSEVQHFLSRIASGHVPKKAHPASPKICEPIRPYPAIDVRNDLAVQPRIEAIAACRAIWVHQRGPHPQQRLQLVAHVADEILAKTGIEQRRYTSESLEGLSLRAARSALAHAQVGPDQVGAVIVCTCTSLGCYRQSRPGFPARWASSRRTARSTLSLRVPASATGWPRPENSATGTAAGARGLRGKVLRQDRERPAVPDDLRRRRGRHCPRRRT